jgi:3'-phosphoadenosine 5'-phosphosulfate sulfotransferase (PAPS reductase)/FAD synthetase
VSDTTIYHIGISGGKDSTALLLWARYESGIPINQLRVTFCNTGNEAPATYRHVRMLSKKVHPVIWLKPPLYFFQLARKRKRFPSTRARFCTQELKLKPTKAYIEKLQAGGYNVICLSGVRAQESVARAKLPERTPAWLSYFGCEEWRPLLYWKIAEVWAIHERYKIPRNPLYDDGMSRVGCFPCINSRKEEIRLIARKYPERIEMLREQEARFNNINGISTFFPRNKVPLAHRTKEISTASGEKMKVATIDDVVQWSQTGQGGRQFTIDFDESTSSTDTNQCPSSIGACE